MTTRRYPEALPRVLRTGKENALIDAAYRAQRVTRKLDAADRAAEQAARAAGLLPHITDVDNPFAPPVVRQCEPGCWQHRRTA